MIPRGVVTIGSSAFYGCTGLSSVTIPEGVTTIGSSAFYGCAGLTEITLPGTVSAINSSAFYGCTGLKEINLSGGLITIEDSAFRDCKALESVMLPNTVTTIGSNAFYGCTGLSEIEIPNAVTELKYNTFYGCTGLESITLPESLTTIGSSAFSGCTSLSGIVLPEGLETIGSEAFYKCESLTEITIPGGVTAIASYTFQNCSGLKHVAISEGVETISSSAFWDCTALESVSIPGTVATIEAGTFSGKTNLKSVTLGDGVTTIGNNGFYGCSNLADLELLDSLTSIGSSAFSGCTSLSGIVLPQGLTTIGDNAFSGCKSLTEITIPGGVETIGEEVFYECDGLKTVVIREGVKTIDYRVFYSCNALEKVTIPASVTYINNQAFAYCPKLTEIYFGHLSSAELAMEYNAFYLSEYGDYKDVPTVVYVPYDRDIHSTISGYEWDYYGRDVSFASSGYLPVQTITIDTHQAQMEAGLTMTLTATMDPWYCTSDLIWEVIPGTGEASIDQNGVLMGLEPGFVTVRCVSTDDVTIFDETQVEILKPTAYVSSITIRCDSDIEAEVEVGGSVQMLAQIEPGNAMDKSVTWEVENGSGKATITDDGVLSGIATGTVTVYATANDGTEVMGSRVVEVVRYVTDITICLNGKAEAVQLGVGEKAALSAKVIPEDANYTDVTWQLENGTGQAELTGDRYNRSLKGISPGTVTLMAISTDSRKLVVSKEIEIVGEKLAYAVTGGNLYYNSVTGTIVGCDNTVTNANIPGIIAGTRITSIAPEAFYDHDQLASVTIPSSVESIGDYAFYDCEGLTSLRINGAGLKTVGKNAFEYCSSLTNLTIPESVVSIGNYAFWGLASLKNLTIPGDLDCRDWLSYNGALETLTLTGSRVISTANYEVHEGGGLSWYGDSSGRNAKTVIIRDSVEKIEEFAFLGCDDMTSVTVGSGVAAIGRYAFYDCDALETIAMGSKVKTIGDHAFESCGKLKEITLPEGIESLGESAFSRCNALEKINLPDSLKHIGRFCFETESYNVKLQLIDLSGNPTQMKEQELQLTYKISTVLVTATNNKSSLWWHLAYTQEDYEAGRPDPYEIAWIDGETGMIHARGSGTVTVVCRDEYTGAEGRWTIDISAGVVIRSEDDRDYVVSGETLQLSAWMMPANEKVDVDWSLRSQDAAYATISESGKVTAKSVSSAHQIEVTAHPMNGSEPVSMDLWVVPKTTGLYIYEGSGDVTGSELAVDMAQIPSIQLTAVAQPEGAVGDAAWKTSAEAVASVDGGLVTFNSPGTVTITATAADGSGKTASVKFNVTYRDTAKTLTAIADAPNNTLQFGQKARIYVYGADPDNALDPSLLEFGVPDSQKHIATVDETGLVTAGEMAGTVTVTASLKGDPMGRRVNVKITVIARQTEKLVLRTDAPAPAQVQMLDETGRITTDAAAAANYVVLLSKADVAEGAYAFVITPEAYTAAGSGNPGKAGLKWATSNSKLATVSVYDDGTALVTVKEGADGACVISAVTTDDAKLENRLTINVRDYAPRQPPPLLL